MNCIISFLVFVLANVGSFILDKVFNKSTGEVGLVYIIGSVTVSVLFFVLYIRSTIRLKKNKAQSLESEFEKTKANTLGVETNNDEGTRLLLMALTQSSTEPLKYKYLEASAINNHNIFAALLLADVYKTGIKKKNHYIITPDRNKAFDIYRKVKDYDQLGIINWELGWIYEKNRVDSIKKMRDSDRKTIACKYYNESAKKGFVKAYNSLGKFFYYGLGGLEKDPHKAESYYQMAAQLGDVYAIMNCGLISMSTYNNKKDKDINDLKIAKAYFEKAVEYDNSEGYLQLGIVYENLKGIEPGYLSKAKENYIKAIKSVENVFCASAYYRLGKLINKAPELKKDKEIIELLMIDEDASLSAECFRRSYDIFRQVEKAYGIDRIYKKDYEALKELFQSIK